MKRNGFGTGGRAINITVNAFPITVPEGTIYHYDGQYCKIFFDVKYRSKKINLIVGELVDDEVYRAITYMSSFSDRPR